MNGAIMQRKLITYLGVTLGLTSLIHAFDGQKEGLFVSVGAGLAATHSTFKEVEEGWSDGKELEMGLATSFKIGYGFNENLSLYLIRHSAFVHGYKNASNSDTYGNCLTGIGVNYTLPSHDNLYLLGAVGQGQLSRLSESDSKAQKGKAFLMGMGYTISSHLHLEGTYLGTRIDDTMKLDSDSFHLTLNYYWY